MQDKFRQAINWIENNFEGLFDWQQLSKVDRSLDLRVQKILESSLIINNLKQCLEFDEDAAKLEMFLIKQTFQVELPLNLTNLTTSGLQEKYLKSQLSDNELLQEVDIKRFIANSGMLGHIFVLNLEQDLISLLLTNMLHKNAKQYESYSQAVMINFINDGKANWLAVVFCINPLEYSLTYEISPTHELTEQEFITFEKILRQSIPDLGRIGAKINSAKLSEYMVLHALYQAAELEDYVIDNKIANDFKNIPENLIKLRKFIYDEQLSSIKLEPSLNNIIDISTFKNMKVSTIARCFDGDN